MSFYEAQLRGLEVKDEDAPHRIQEEQEATTACKDLVTTSSTVRRRLGHEHQRNPHGEEGPSLANGASSVGAAQLIVQRRCEDVPPPPLHRGVYPPVQLGGGSDDPFPSLRDASRLCFALGILTRQLVARFVTSPLGMACGGSADVQS